MKKKKNRGTGWSKNRDVAQNCLMIAPMLTGSLLFTIYPMLWLVRRSWFDYDGTTTAKFTGFANYIRALTRDIRYRRPLASTFLTVGGRLALEIPLALFLVVVLNSGKKVNALLRILFFSPAAVGVAIAGIVFYLLFGSFQGPINLLLKQSGLIARNVNWFGTKGLADTVTIPASVWRGFGTNITFFVMGLQNIPLEIYECVSLDGVNTRTRLTKIMLPTLPPIIKIVMMLSLVNGIKMSDMVLALTNGQPDGPTEAVMSHTFKHFFSYSLVDTISQYGYSSALVVITALTISIVIDDFLKATKQAGDFY